MSVNEYSALVRYRDGVGNTNIIYPINRIEDIDGMENGLFFRSSSVVLPSDFVMAYPKMCYGAGKIAMAECITSGDGSNVVFYTEDGLNWNRSEVSSTTSLSSIEYVHDRFVVASRSIMSNELYWSFDCVTWSAVTMPVAANWVKITYGNGLFVASGAFAGEIAYSTDFDNWTLSSDKPQTIQNAGVAYGNGKFVLISPQGYTMTSEDGDSWSTHFNGTAANLNIPDGLNTIIFANGKFVAGGGTCEIWVSEDGVAWTKTLVTDSDHRLCSMSYTGSKFIVCVSNFTNGDTITVCHSDDAVTWVTTVIPDSSYAGACVRAYDMFVLATNSTILISNDGTEWSNHISYIVDRDGTDVTDVVRSALSIGNKQDKITGSEGQIVGFDTDGNIVAQDMPTAGISIVAAASTDGVTYTATLDNVIELTIGMQVIFIPAVTSTSTSASLDINSLGAKTIRMASSAYSSATMAPTNAGYFAANKPVTLTYNGTFWVTDMARPNAPDLYGVVPIANGGIPVATSDNEGQFLRVVSGVPTWVTIQSDGNLRG